MSKVDSSRLGDKEENHTLDDEGKESPVLKSLEKTNSIKLHELVEEIEILSNCEPL